MSGKVSLPVFHAVSAIRMMMMMMMIPCLALVPHPFWNHRVVGSKSTTPRRGRRSTSSSLCMYFDDCERRDDLDEQWEPLWSSSSRTTTTTTTTTTPWILSRSEEKKLAMEQLLGYSPESAATLSDAQVEEETLQWAADTNILGVQDDDQDQDQQLSMIRCKYHAISDLIVASSTTVTDSLALVWNLLARLISGNEQKSVYLIAFPRAKHLWDYDVMVTMLQAIQISKSLFPPELTVQLDLFHPDYKHSLRMWSPETHAPFPTLGIQIIRRNTEDDNMDAVRSKLKALFDSNYDAVDVPANPHDERGEPMTSGQALEACQQWWTVAHPSSIPESSSTSSTRMEWMVQSDKEPYQLYTTLWNAISQLLLSKTTTMGSSAMVVAPHLDAHTTHRVAVTVNAALQRLKAPVRIHHVFHPNNHKYRKSPYAMIHLVHI